MLDARMVAARIHDSAPAAHGASARIERATASSHGVRTAVNLSFLVRVKRHYESHIRREDVAIAKRVATADTIQPRAPSKLLPLPQPSRGAVLKQLPIYFHGSISLQEIEEALNSRAIHLRDDGRGRFLAERVPHFLTHAANSVSEQAAAPRAMRLVGK
jgi:hypothetical protein